MRLPIAIALAIVTSTTACTYKLIAEPPSGASPAQVSADKEECEGVARSENSLEGRAPPESAMYRKELFNLYSSCLSSRGYKWRAEQN